jgi:hypothetical protein
VSAGDYRKSAAIKLTEKRITLMRPAAFGEALPGGTRLTLFSDDKPDRFFIVSQILD